VQLAKALLPLLSSDMSVAPVTQHPKINSTDFTSFNRTDRGTTSLGVDLEAVNANLPAIQPFT
jgi:hypothetical protein